MTYPHDSETRRLNLIQRNARAFMGLTLVMVDFLTIIFCAFISTHFTSIFPFIPRFNFIQWSVPCALAFILVYMLMGLYFPGISPVNELRRLFISTSLVSLFILGLFIWFQNLTILQSPVLLFFWVSTLVFVPSLRALTRKVLSHYGLWGEPVAIIGYGQVGYKLVTYLSNNPTFGFIPYIVIDRRKKDRPESRPRHEKVIVKRIEEILTEGQKSLEGIGTAILVTTETPGDFYEAITDIRLLKFPRLIVVSLIEQQSSLWLQPYDLGGIIGIEIGQNLINWWQQSIKRIIDLILIGMLLPIILPLVGVIAVLVALDSRGSIFYSNSRVGKSGVMFRKWKFRTMIPNADEALENYLNNNPEMREEWNTTQKLKNDPRVTRLGRFLRKYSLDELPQLWNVFIGEMSLVGPRPIIDAEQYGNCYNLYIHVRPGLTGLWQVSGRNDVPYSERVRMDEYYIRNWSIWLDVIILARTPLTVIKGTGAY